MRGVPASSVAQADSRVPDKWASRPDGYVMVGGTIDFAGCTTLNVTRVTAEAR